MGTPKYRINKEIKIIDHEGNRLKFEANEIFTWNQHRFVCVADGAQVSRAKVRDAGAKMIPLNADLKDLDLSPAGPDIELPEPMVAERKVAFSL